MLSRVKLEALFSHATDYNLTTPYFTKSTPVREVKDT